MIINDGSPTISADGDLLETGIIGSGGNPTAISGGAGSGSNEEIVLKSNTKYLLRCQNLTNTATVVTAKIFWYEEDAG